MMAVATVKYSHLVPSHFLARIKRQERSPTRNQQKEATRRALSPLQVDFTTRKATLLATA
jgi:hypothetical protein